MNALEKRRKQLGMTKVSLAKRAGLTVQTVRRTLQGQSQKIETLRKLAEVLGMRMQVSFEPLQTVDALRAKEASRKAKKLVSLAQGTAALEAQAVPQSVIEDAIVQTQAEILAGSRRRLWE